MSLRVDFFIMDADLTRSYNSNLYQLTLFLSSDSYFLHIFKTYSNAYNTSRGLNRKQFWRTRIVERHCIGARPTRRGKLSASTIFLIPNPMYTMNANGARCRKLGRSIKPGLLNSSS